MSKRTPASRAEVEANRAFKPAPLETTETEYAKTQKAFDDNRARLKAERLAREAAGEFARKQKPSS